LEANQWAFASDYARLKIIYEEGGIYLDTDVEVIKPLKPLISKGIGFIGFQNPYEATTGLGFAAAPHNPIVKAMLNIYDNRHFKYSDENYFIDGGIAPNENAKGVIQLDETPTDAKRVFPLVGVNITTSNKIIEELKKYTKGFFFVR
jgi:hypothetical protein